MFVTRGIMCRDKDCRAVSDIMSSRDGTDLFPFMSLSMLFCLCVRFECHVLISGGVSEFAWIKRTPRFVSPNLGPAIFVDLVCFR